MLFVFICTEGENSEPACLNAFINAMPSQMPRSGEEYAEVLTVSVKGNHGYKVLLERAEEEIKKHESDPESLFSLAADDDTEEVNKEKWLVCDYDELDTSGISYKEFKQSAIETGYTLIMNKPKFEYYVLAALAGWELAEATSVKQIGQEINNQIDKLNEMNMKEKNFSDAQKLPHYSKKVHVAEEFFGKLLSYNLELVLDLPINDAEYKDKFSDMPKLIARLRELYGYN